MGIAVGIELNGASDHDGAFAVDVNPTTFVDHRR